MLVRKNNLPEVELHCFRAIVTEAFQRFPSKGKFSSPATKILVFAPAISLTGMGIFALDTPALEKPRSSNWARSNFLLNRRKNSSRAPTNWPLFFLRMFLFSRLSRPHSKTSGPKNKFKIKVLNVFCFYLSSFIFSLEQLAAIPQFSRLGPLFRSSPKPVELTESETEYVVNCVKHIFKEHVVFQVT